MIFKTSKAGGKISAFDREREINGYFHFHELMTVSPYYSQAAQAQYVSVIISKWRLLFIYNPSNIFARARLV